MYLHKVGYVTLRCNLIESYRQTGVHIVIDFGFQTNKIVVVHSFIYPFIHSFAHS